MTIDLDTPAPPPARTYGVAWAAAACAASVLFGAAVVKVADMPAPTAAPAVVQLHTVTVAASGAKPYIALTGTVEQGGVGSGPLLLPAGTTVHVFVVGTAVGAEVSCSIGVDGVTLATSQGFGLGAVAQCDLRIKGV